MTSGFRRASLGLVALLGLLLAGASFAWACAPQATVGVQPSSGPSGAQVTVSAAGFREAPVAVYWGSEGGPVLATANGPTFSVTVTIPKASPGAYYLVAQHTGDLAYSHPSASTAFNVTAPEPAEQQQAPAPQPSTGASADPGPSQAAAPPPAASGGQQASPAPAPAPNTETTRAQQQQQQRAAARPPAAAATAANVSPAPSPGPAPATPEPAAAPDPVAAVAPPEPEPAVAPVDPGSGDLWSGESSSDKVGLADRPTPAGASDRSSPFPVGVALLVAGLVALAATAAVLTVRSRRRERVPGSPAE